MNALCIDHLAHIAIYCTCKLTCNFGAGGDIYIEHGYLFDRQDLEQHPMGRIFLESGQVADAELVDSSGVYHSLASVIEGERAILQVNPHRSPDLKHACMRA